MVAGPGKRHTARGTPRAQPRDVRSAGRDTWNLTSEALGGPSESDDGEFAPARDRGASPPSGALTYDDASSPSDASVYSVYR